MKPELLTNRDAAITTHDEENARATALISCMRGVQNRWPCGRRLAKGRRRSSRKQRTKRRPSLKLKDHCENRW